MQRLLQNTSAAVPRYQLRAVKYVGLLLTTLLGVTASESTSNDFTTSVKPILKQHCFSCHGPEKQKAKLRLDTTDPDMINGIDGETWHEVMHNIQRGDMPPEDKPPLSSAERQTIINWVQSSINKAAQQRAAAHQTLRRLTREEYNNTMRDLIGIDLDYSGSLPSESISPDGFTNNGASLGFSPMHLEQLLDTARMALSKAIVEGPEPAVNTSKFWKKNEFRPELPKGDPVSGDLIFCSSGFRAIAKEYIREGEFKITAKLNVVVPPGAQGARIEATLGYQAGQIYPSESLGEFDIAESGVHELTWTGRMERMPLPEVGAKNDKIVIHILHLPDDGSKLVFQTVGGGKTRIRGGKISHPRDPEKFTHFTVQEVTFTSPAITTWPPPSHRDIMLERSSHMSDAQYAHAVIKRFTERAFRRPVTESDLVPFIELYNDVIKETKSDLTAIRETLAMVLVSPEFLYLLQPNAQQSKPRQLTSAEIASRLSYFLWGTMPDEALAAAAQSNKLVNTNDIISQARRLLQHEKAKHFSNTFVDQWLGLGTIDNIAVAPEYYPDFNDELKPFMREETRLLFADTLFNNMSVMNLLNANYTFLNEPLAKHYGIVGPKGAAFQRVNLKPTDKRGGLLTQASILLAGSTGEDSHPIRRAVWVRDRLLHDPPLPPPPDVPPLDEDNVDTAKLSLKKQLELHRKRDACFDCHKNLDPWGIPFEHYDAVGQWRDQVKRLVPKADNNEAQGKKKKKEKKNTPEFAYAEVDDSTVLPGNKPVTGVDALRQHLLKHERDRFADNMVRRLTTYAIGRSLTFRDQPELEKLSKQFATNDYRLGDLVMAIVTNPLFLHQ